MASPNSYNFSPNENSLYPNNIGPLNLTDTTLYPTNSIYPSVPVVPNSSTNAINTGLSSITSVLNTLSGMALPIEKDVGAVSQIYNQVHQMNPTAQVPYVNTAFYQSPQGSLAGSMGQGIGGFFQNMGIGGWVVLGLLAVGGIWAISKI